MALKYSLSQEKARRKYRGFLAPASFVDRVLLLALTPYPGVRSLRPFVNPLLTEVSHFRSQPGIPICWP